MAILMSSCLALFLLNVPSLDAQKDVWAIFPTDIEFDTGTSTGTLPTTLPSGGFIAENAVYINEKLQFYVRCVMQGLNGNFELLDANGTIYGVPNEMGRFSNKELEIVPVPGTCDLYCVMFTSPAGLVQSEFTYFEVRVNEDGTLQVYPMKNGKALLNTSTGIAVSKRLLSSNDRNIYIVGEGLIHEYTISENGIGLTAEINLGTNNNADIFEADISPDGDYLAWGGSSSDLYIHDIFLGLTYTINIPGPFQSLQVAGVEFYQIAEAAPRLYASAENALYVIEDFLTTSPTITAIPNSMPLGRTQLEVAKDGFLYGVSAMGFPEQGFLTQINPATNAVTVLTDVVGSFQSHFVPSDATFSWGLPQQIDGEGDALFLGIDPPELSNPSIEGTILPDMVTTAPTFYDCNSLDFSFDVVGDYDNFNVEIISVNEVDGTPIFGSKYLYYNNTFPASTPLPIDLRCLVDPINCNLFKAYNGQTFIINITVDGECENEVLLSGYFSVFGAPSPITIDFEMASGSGAVCQATTIANACLVGNNGLSFNASNSSGQLDYYRVNIREVDCTNGSSIGAPLFIGTDEPYPTSTGLNLNLNALYINGAQGYFAMNAATVDGSCFLIELTLGNVCGEDSDFSYFEIDPALYLNGDFGAEGNLNIDTKRTERNEPLNVQFSPQPVRDMAQLRVASTNAKSFELIVYTSNAQLILRKTGELTDENIPLDLSNLSSGLYFYQLQLAGEDPLNGKFIKQ